MLEGIIFPKLPVIYYTLLYSTLAYSALLYYTLPYGARTQTEQEQYVAEQQFSGHPHVQVNTVFTGHPLFS